ncbi:MAG TPA: hypothetical protein VN680_17930 [Burkholderiaceae bacterium]|jgi:hypothetical protein|nr:hypothetical protein [Burkholderiaceae bacterium]
MAVNSRLCKAMIATGVLLAAGRLLAADAAIFTCTNAQGKRMTADRPIAECMDREQRVLNRDGSVRNVMPPSMTSEERAAAEEVERKRAIERAAQKDAVRRDRNMLARYPDEATHQKARDTALDAARGAISLSEARLADLQRDRKPLTDEAEFYKGKALPFKLKTQIEAVETSIAAQRELLVTQQAEVGRITSLYDAELRHLKKLWAGAQPGSLGMAPEAEAVNTGSASLKADGRTATARP